MWGVEPIGKFLIFLGILFLVLGVLFVVAPKIPYIGKLPGDIYIKRDNFTFYFPLVSSIIISIILTLVLNLIFRR